MDILSRTGKICRLSLTNSRGYEYCGVANAHHFFQQQDFSSNHTRQQNILVRLHSLFQAQNSALAGLCLRCYVSYAILKACQRIDSLFSGEKRFTYRDLLPFVLNDDGKTLIILDDRNKTQLTVTDGGKTQPQTYPLFSVEILRTYQSNSEARMSLDNWAHLQTRQNPELKNFLSEFGFRHLSDWAILNRVRSPQLNRLAHRDRALCQVFHAVYRRDRRLQRQKIGKCPEPTESQLQEMLTLLKQQIVVFNNTKNILKALKQVAIQLRNYDVWNSREPLEIYEPESGNYSTRADLPITSSNEIENQEQQELLSFLQQSLKSALQESIEREIRDRLTKLSKSKQYSSFAKQFVPGLQLYYCQQMSLREIAPLLGMNNWDRARRVLNPGELLSKIRTLTIQQLLDSILTKAKALGLTQIPPSPDYLKLLVEQIENFADEEIFQAAVAEIKAGKNRSLDSFYAQELRIYLEKYPEGVK